MTTRPLCADCGERQTVARGRCMRCYKRHRAGKPPPAPDRTGQRSGHGLYGLLDDDGDTLLCHECGNRYRSVAGHIYLAHGMYAAQYRAAHGIPKAAPLISRAVTEAQSAQARARVEAGGDGWQRFTEARNPAAAAAARTWATPPASVSRARAAVARTNGRAARTGERVATCPHCGAQWCPLPGGYRRRLCLDPACRAADQRRAGRQGGATRAARSRPLTADDVRRLRTLAGAALLDLLQELRDGGATQTAMQRPADSRPPASAAR